MVIRFFILLILASFLFTPSYADTTTEISGKYSVTGTHLDKSNIAYQYYTHELDLLANISIEETTLTTEFGIIDETWGKENNTGNADMELDRCWITHMFPTDFKLEVGKMTGKTWGTMLGNNSEDGFYRIRGTKIYGNTIFSGYIQKNLENGETNPSDKNAEKDDSDAVSIGGIHKIGCVSLMPKITYTYDSSIQPEDRDTDGTQTLEIIFAALAKKGTVTFEAEMIYSDISSDYPLLSNTPMKAEYSLFNIWTDIKIDFESVITGIALAYGTEDGGNGPGSFGHDFSPMTIMDNDGGAVSNLGAMFFAKLYAETEPLSGLITGCAFAYGNYEDDAYNINPDSGTPAIYSNKTNIYEINITGEYSITKALKYSAVIAYADIEAFRDEIIQVEHKLVFSF